MAGGKPELVAAEPGRYLAGPGNGQGRASASQEAIRPPGASRPRSYPALRCRNAGKISVAGADGTGFRPERRSSHLERPGASHHGGFTIIPIAIILDTISGRAWQVSGSSTTFYATTTGGLLFLAPLLMILFRRKYPRWWFDWNLELQRFGNRVWTYLALMNDQYPSTDEHQWLHLDYPYPDAASELNRWLPLIKWFLAIPHYIVLFFLDIGLVVVVIVAWFAILFTGRYPQGMFRFVEGVARWHNRVIAYALTLVTDRYPPFRLAQ
jgi:hypothetical protein